MESITKVERPTFNEEMIAELAESVADILKQHNPDSDRDDCLKAAKEVLKWEWNEDGYHLTKEFEEKGFEGSTDIVYDLDGVAYDARKILEKAVRAWVAKNNITLDLPIGAIITFDAWKKNNEVGEIVKLYPETAQYGIWCESIGRPKVEGHYLIASEKIKSVKSKPE